MIEILKIKNFAIIDSAEIHFKQGLNILSGETGAGKSIVIEAISLLLGSRASLESIRAGCDEAVIEGLFQISGIPWIATKLEQFGFDKQSPELIIKRTVHRAGKHRIYVNGELATLSVLQSLCDGLIDLCSQHEHQSLLKPSKQLELLDRYGGLGDQAKAVSATFKQRQSLRQERDELQKAEHERERRSGFLKFQIDEIRTAELEPGEDQTLLQQKQLLQSAEGRVQAAESVRQVLEGDEQGALNFLRIALQRLRSLELLDGRVQPIVESLERAVVETEEVTLTLNRYITGVEGDLDPERLQSVQERLSLLADLRRKYGNDASEILAMLSQLENDFSSLGEVSEKLGRLTLELESTEKELKKLGKRLSHARKSISKVLADTVTDELKDLKMGEAKFLIELTTKEDLEEWSSTGGDLIQFVVQTNPGEPARPLGKIASGGELSRLMLAIRRMIADRGGIGVYLFDEIDSGMGGQTAFQVGKKLKSVSTYNQVICITHLPQVASFADHHLVVRKSVQGSRTLTEITALTKKEKKEELARMLGGPELTKKSIENASELLELANQAFPG